MAEAPSTRDDPPRTLAQLNAYIRRATAARRAEGDHPDELGSVRRFRQAWERHRTGDRLQQAVARSPANAGPLNPHALVLRSLERMGDLSPDYLRRFIELIEALQWLERAAAPSPRERPSDANRPARRRRRK
ncbi:DUF2894 domain-containing protein [Ramlibacter sp.]|uniref:DUF2894 domain-containing protein n=1 Tax=Ramlibacter sp. TaxID=1917967 RepID=UPI002FCB7552